MTDRMFDYKDGEAFYKSYYGHLQTGSFKVTAGDKVIHSQEYEKVDNSDGLRFSSRLLVPLRVKF
jgi:hypothetical protein